MGQCTSGGSRKPAPKVKLPERPVDPADEARKAKEVAFREERKLRHNAKWTNPNSAHTKDLQSVVWEQIRYRRHPGTEGCRNFLCQIVLIRKVPKQIPENHYSDLNPSGTLAWYLNFRYNTFSHYLDGWEETRPSRLAPVLLKDQEWNVLIDEVKKDDGDVTWRYGVGVPDEDPEYKDYEALVCPGRWVNWPKVSGVFGDVPQFPMHLMKGSIIKSLDASKPFAIPNHEQAMKQGYLIALHKCIKARGEEADYEQPDIVKRGVPDRVSSTAPYTVPVFELTDNRGYLAPTW